MPDKSNRLRLPRVGIGFDTHRFRKGRALVLGGVTIPSPKGLDGHSDADVICHAVMDALLGAVGNGDIGRHFPDTDARWKGACSLDLLKHVVRLLKGDGWGVGNVDVMVLAEMPRLAPHVQAMREHLGRAMAIPVSGVSIKATTMERMGAVGRREGIAVMAVALVAPVTRARGRRKGKRLTRA
ncbi:MAG: 2-C-methyl-D-erythritol 2,4-cyclodiphosphate synthase [Lentisphaerae bacterium RIFOXYB12_FULL_60_10]|nr:MAG: 2-C-methyl-D-erythritol 2,4-cyclodiphosphate synthase [Lentisphaerae bacterium RIFOXYB12_FULL_60_10]